MGYKAKRSSGSIARENICKVVHGTVRGMYYLIHTIHIGHTASIMPRQQVLLLVPHCVMPTHPILLTLPLYACVIILSSHEISPSKHTFSSPSLCLLVYGCVEITTSCILPCGMNDGIFITIPCSVIIKLDTFKLTFQFIHFCFGCLILATHFFMFGFHVVKLLLKIVGLLFKLLSTQIGFAETESKDNLSIK